MVKFNKYVCTHPMHAGTQTHMWAHACTHTHEHVSIYEHTHTHTYILPSSTYSVLTYRWGHLPATVGNVHVPDTI